MTFWKTGNRSSEFHEDVILRNWEPCRDIEFQEALLLRRRRRHRSRRQHSATGQQAVRGHTSRLWPYASVTAGVSVLNAGGKPGHISDTIEFRTLEGGLSHWSRSLSPLCRPQVSLYFLNHKSHKFL